MVNNNEESKEVSPTSSPINAISLIGSYLSMTKLDPEGKVINFANGIYLIGRSVSYDAKRAFKVRAKKMHRGRQSGYHRN